ncbi:hypothetical protein IMZ48_22445 [Candidatus Bathyarchaeota archaeon]|nr:hypothetical protein [Candidatus Bathyarchaeota archaeon]
MGPVAVAVPVVHAIRGAVHAIRVRMSVGGGGAVAVGPRGRRLGVVLLRGEEVAAERVGELEVGSKGARLADDGGAARDDVPVGKEG